MAKLMIYFDYQKTVSNETLHAFVTNIKKCPEIANAHSTDLTLYADGIELRASFFKDATLYDGLRIELEQDLTHMEWITLINGITFDSLTISYNNGETKIPTQIYRGKISDSEKEKMAAKVAETSKAHVKSFWKGLEKSTKNTLFGLGSYYEELGGVVGFVNDDLSTDKSFTYQMIFPSTHPRRSTFLPDEVPIKFYYQFDGYLYEAKTTYLKGIGDFYQWEISGLEPGSIYVGMSFSMDGGKTIFPSTGLFGITRNSDGTLPDIDDAQMKKPFEQAGYKKHQMWNEQLALKFMGKELTKITYDMIVKKQYEFDNDDAYVAIAIVDEYYSNYEWLKTGKKLTAEDK